MPPKELGMVLRLDTNSIHRLTDLTKLAWVAHLYVFFISDLSPSYGIYGKRFFRNAFD